MSPTVKTVLGDVDPGALGRTLTHEHLSMRFDVAYAPAYGEDQSYKNLPWEVKNLGWINQFPYGHSDNLVMNDAISEKAILESVQIFKDVGGGCIVENSTVGLQRKTKFLREVSEKTGIHVVAGTGYYVGEAQNEDVKANATVETMAKHMIGELNDGCIDEPSIKCGFIGEIGCSESLLDVEKRAVRASAVAQECTGAAVSFHPGRCSDSPFEIMRVFMEAGGQAGKAILSHTERTLQTPELLSEFSKFGSYIQYDLFGIEKSYYGLKPTIDFPSDAQRIDGILHLLRDEQAEDRILVAHDIHTKHRLEKFGGHGFKHLLKYGVEKMSIKGISPEQIDKIFIHNPARLLAF